MGRGRMWGVGEGTFVVGGVVVRDGVVGAFERGEGVVERVDVVVVAVAVGVVVVWSGTIPS